MLNDAKGFNKVVVICGRSDLRKGIDGLAAIVQSQYHLDSTEKAFDTTKTYGRNSYPWDTEISEISDVIEQYIQCPEANLMQSFAEDHWGVTDILRVCDRRIGKRRLRDLQAVTTKEALLRVIEKRLNKP